MSKIKISLLGSWQIDQTTGQIKKELRRKEQGLLAYLAVESSQSHSRDSLIGLFWPDLPQSDARNNLRVALSRLKRHFRDSNTLASSRHTVRFNHNDQVHLDVSQFLALISQAETHAHRSLSACHTCQEQLKQAVHLYREEFLSGFFLEDCLVFEEWLFVWRERLHVQVLKLLAQLVQVAEDSGRFADSEQYARRQLELDPLHEQAHRQLMRALYAQGQRSAALNQFKACAAILQAELGVEPEVETTLLQQAIEANSLDLARATAESAHQARLILPETTTPFIGRETELEQLAQRLAERQYRLISLVGPGGIGKTRLAVQAARAQLDNFPDGVYFVPLEGVQSATEIPSAIAEAMALSFTASAASPQAEMMQILQDKNLLLVIDNLEHVLDEGASFLLELVNNAPDLVLLVTSRERINAQIEDMFRLRGLSYPELGHERDGGHYAAIRLFVDRAHRINKTFGLTEANLPDVVAICRLVEGLPLGVELAATWARDFSVQQIATSLQADFDLLETDLRDVSARHRSMATVFEHSWRSLTEKEQAVLAQLSVFRGGFTLATAQAITGASPLLLTRLRYKSLIRSSGSGRYTMHELLRQLSQRKLQENGDTEEQTKARHGHYFLTLVQEQAPRLNRDDAALASALLRLELDNIRQAWRWVIHHSAFDHLQQSIEGLATFFYHEGLAFEGAQLLQLAIEAVQATTKTEDSLRPLLLVKQASLLGHFRSYDELVAIIEQIFLLTNKKPELAHLEAEANLLWANHSLDQVADPHQAKFYLDKAAAIVDTLNDWELTAQLLSDFGRFYFFDGQFDRAVEILNKALVLYAEQNHLPGQALAYARLAPAYAEAYILGPALLCDRKALSLYTQMDNRTRIGYTQHGLGETYMLLGAYAQAIEYFDKSLVHYRRQGSKQNEANVLAPYATALNGLGQTAAAEKYYRLAITQQKEMQLSFCLSFSLLDWGVFQLEQGWLTEAELTLNEAYEINQDREFLRLTTEAQLATVYLAQGNQDDEALTLADMVWQAIAPNEGYGLPFPIKTMYECYLVFKAYDDERAITALQMAVNVMKKTAATITDTEMQACFLNNVLVNKTIQQLIGEIGPS